MILSRQKYSHNSSVFFLLIPVKIHGRENYRRTLISFLPDHQGSFDIFLIYVFIGRNFKWMMKKSLRKDTIWRKSAGHIFVDRSGPKNLETIRQAKDSLSRVS